MGGDAVGVGSYDDTAQQHYPLTPISDDTIKTAAQSAVHAIFVGGNTSIGAGLVTGRDQLLGRGASDYAWAIVLLVALKTLRSTTCCRPSRRRRSLFTIGLGNVNEPLMSRMAQETGGSYCYAPSPAISRIYNSTPARYGRRALIAAPARTQAIRSVFWPCGARGHLRHQLERPRMNSTRLLDPPDGVDPPPRRPGHDRERGDMPTTWCAADPGDWTLEIAAAATARDNDDQVGFDISVQAVADLMTLVSIVRRTALTCSRWPTTAER
jgi:hypothetical protein